MHSVTPKDAREQGKRRVHVPFSRRVLFRLATSGGIERAGLAVPAVKRRLYRRARRYVAGETLSDALDLATVLLGEGFAVSLDLFGEAIEDPHAVKETGRRYVELARAVISLPGDAWLSADLSHLGLDVSESLCLEQLEAIAAVLPAGRRIQVGAEDTARNPAIQRVILAAARAGCPLMATVQANLSRSAEDVAVLADAGIPIRLVKGAYVEARSVALPWGEATDLAYLRLAHRLRAAGADFVIATHDPVLRESILTTIDGLGVEMLLGVRPEDARELVQRRVGVRLYVPFGERWFRYCARRIAESRGSH
jgi:proline dehydrogenase